MHIHTPLLLLLSFLVFLFCACIRLFPFAISSSFSFDKFGLISQVCLMFTIFALKQWIRIATNEARIVNSSSQYIRFVLPSGISGVNQIILLWEIAERNFFWEISKSVAHC